MVAVVVVVMEGPGAAAARANSSGLLTLRVDRPVGSMAANSDGESSRTRTSGKKAMMRLRPDSRARRAAAAQALFEYARSQVGATVGPLAIRTASLCHGGCSRLRGV